jgi:hypothetical protein
MALKVKNNNQQDGLFLVNVVLMKILTGSQAGERQSDGPPWLKCYWTAQLSNINDNIMRATSKS